jgi:hypothetical protein
MTKEEAEQLIFNEALIGEILAIRKSPDESPKSKTWRQLVFETTGGTALITVLLGGILGGAVTALFQYMQKNNEIEHAEQQARLERERSANDRLEQVRLEAAKRLFELTYKGISSSEDVLQLSTQPFADPALKDQRTQIRKQYNDAEESWRKDHAVQGLMFVYYHRAIPGLSDRWGKTEKAVSDYIDCASNWIVSHPFYTPGLPGGCTEEKKKVDDDFAMLERSLVSPTPGAH